MHSTVCIKAKCLSEMRKDRLYKILLCMDAYVYDVIGAKFGCPAGKGPGGNGKLCAMPLKNLVVLVNYQDMFQLKQWNKPREKKVPIILVRT